MNSSVVFSCAILLLLGLVITSINADSRILRKRSVGLPSEDSLSQELSRELKSLQDELEELPHLRVTRNATDPAVPGDGGSTGITRVFRFLVQAALIIPRGFLNLAITLLGISSRLVTGFLNGIQSALSTVLRWVNSI